jgi:hypothetical protein
MTTLENVRNAKALWEKACENKWAIWDEMVATAEAEDRTYKGEYGSIEHRFTAEENARLVKANDEVAKTYHAWNTLKNKRAKELRAR